MTDKTVVKKPAVILARVSDIDQEAGHSPDAQLANSHAYAERKDMEVVQVYSITESSTKRDRPEFERMLTFIGKQKQRTALIVDCIDRLNRSFTHHPVLYALMEKDLLEIHFVREGYSIDKDSNSMQKMMFNMGTVMAQSYTDQLKDNIKRSLKHKIETGHWIAKAPVGYRHEYDPEDLRAQGIRKKASRNERRRSKIVIDESRVHLVQRMFTTYATGTGGIPAGNVELYPWQP
jgi:DNA invertase Pin-like site-specific DNA recombinase